MAVYFKFSDFHFFTFLNDRSNIPKFWKKKKKTLLEVLDMAGLFDFSYFDSDIIKSLFSF